MIQTEQCLTHENIVLQRNLHYSNANKKTRGKKTLCVSAVLHVNHKNLLVRFRKQHCFAFFFFKTNNVGNCFVATQNATKFPEHMLK